MTPQTNTQQLKSIRGFASMDRSKQREIARKGGRAAHEQGRAHEFNPDEARTAGRKGGQVVSRDRTHMAEIGRAGGQARGRNRAHQGTGRGSSTVDPGPTTCEGSVPSTETAAE